MGSLRDFTWSWEDACGPNGLIIWSPVTHDFGLCFEEFAVEIPVLYIFAIISSYYYASSSERITRDNTSNLAITIRSITVGLLALIPLTQIYIDLIVRSLNLYPVDYFLTFTRLISWVSHLRFLSALRKRLPLGPRGPFVLRLVWSILAVISFVSLRTHIVLLVNSEQSFELILSLACSSVNFILHLLYALTLVPDDGFEYESRSYRRINEQSSLLRSRTHSYTRFYEDNHIDYLGVALENETITSKLLFHWVNPLIEKGAARNLHETDDLFDLPNDITCNVNSQKIIGALAGKSHVVNRQTYGTLELDFNDAYVTYSGRSLFRALHTCFGLEFYGIGILKFIADCLGFTGPLLLHALVSFIETKSTDIGYGYAYAIALCLTTLIASFCAAHFNFKMAVVGLKIRAAIQTTVYRKILNVKSTVLNARYSTGELINFMTTDTDRIVNSCPSFHAFWSIPFQLAVTLYLLYKQVGASYFVGVAFSVIMIPVNKLIAYQIGRLSGKMMTKKDERVKMMLEILRGIRTIKLHVWEGYFIRVITSIRNKELKYLKWRKYLDALCVYFWATTPVLISTATFTTYVLLGNQLTAATVFTSIALMNMLIGPLNAFPWVLNGVTEAWVSIKRIQRLLELPDLELDDYYACDSDNSNHVEIKNGDFQWCLPPKSEITNEPTLGSIQTPSNDDSFDANNPTAFLLKSINITVKKGELVGVMGTVGSGKSTFLLSILAELDKTNGNVSVAEHEYGFGYVPQEPWLLRGTVRDNILFGKVYDAGRYKRVTDACGLTDDFQTLKHGDLTGVAEGGTTLSGGQKARIGLARAVYQDKLIYVMDDILAAVDTQVARVIFHNCVMGLLKNKTRILCTHHTKYLAYADHIVVLHNGQVKHYGTPTEIFSDANLLLQISELDENLDSASSQYVEEVLHDAHDIGSNFNHSIMFRDKSNEDKDNDSLLKHEIRNVGTIDAKVFVKYWKSIGHTLSLLIFLALLFMQMSRNVTDLWLTVWITSMSNVTNATNITSDVTNLTLTSDITWFAWPWTIVDENIKYYLFVYGLLGLINSIVTFFRAFLFAYGGIVAAKTLHAQLLNVIVRAQTTFFDLSPIGRILNRFSSDTYTVDDSLPFILNILLAQLFSLTGAVIITIYGLPWLCLVLVPLIPVYHWLQNDYRMTSRELKRLSTTSISPLYNQFNETLQGVVSIRAFRNVARFTRETEELIETQMKTLFSQQAIAQWLDLRLQFIGVAMITGIGVIAVVQHQFDAVNASLIGLAISYALSVTGLLNGLVNAFTETEREMIAVERVNQYIDEVEPERDFAVSKFSNPPYAWPAQGVIVFEEVVLKYRDHLTPSLRNVSFETRPAEKIGVVGRTGSGKSSLFAAMFRMVDLHRGRITIDTVDVSTISLSTLRSHLSVIPQDPFLFSGSIRENLDPFREFTSQELWSVLLRCNLTEVVGRLGGLDSTVGAGGENLSIGQRQLLCLARAILHKAQILCIDEATANVDYETDRLIQQALRTTFSRSTVITIAHRIETIMHCNRVIVMADGELVEFDTPQRLMSDEKSHFHALAADE